MKTAENISGDIAIPPLGLELATGAFRDYVIKILEEAQLEAFKEGMRHAGKLAQEHCSVSGGYTETAEHVAMSLAGDNIHAEIMTEAHQLTELPKEGA